MTAIIKVYTESGSIYWIDDEDKTWRRERGQSSASIRSETGKFRFRSEIEEGKYLILTCPPFDADSIYPRLITTTRITMIEVEGE